MAKVRARKLDFTNVKESSGINPKHIESGDYAAKVTDVSEVEAKDGTDMWLFIITPDDHKSATYPYYCKLQENQLWKIRNLFIACGVNIPKKMANVDPNRVVGKALGITLEDDEYEGKMKSVVEATFPVSDLEGYEGDTSPADDDEDDEDEEEAPAPKKSRKKKQPEPVEEEDDDEDEEDDEPEEKPVSARTKKRRAAKAKAEEEDEDDEEEEEPAPKKSRKKKSKPVEDDEDDELDLDDL